MLKCTVCYFRRDVFGHMRVVLSHSLCLDFQLSLSEDTCLSIHSFIPAGQANHVRYRPRSGCHCDEQMKSHSQTYYIIELSNEII